MTAPTPYVAGPFDSTHIYVQWGGKLPGNEEWSCGFRMWSAAGSTQDDAEALITMTSVKIAAFHARADTMISGNAKLSFVKCNAIDVNGHYQSQNTAEVLHADIPGSNSGAVVVANQLAIAVSLTTGFSRGPAHRGRFYLPTPAVNIDLSGRINPANAAGIKGSAMQLLTEVNDNALDHQMVVMSRKAGAPGHRAVTGIQVGTVLDTQRRRRNKLAENYQ